MTSIEEYSKEVLKKKIDAAYVNITKGAEELESAIKGMPYEWIAEFAQYICEKNLIVLSRHKYEEIVQKIKEEE